MEWLCGAFAGGVIGLGSALIVTEYTSRRERQRRKRDFARSLQTEISLATQGLKDIVKTLEASNRAAGLKRVAGPALTRDVYSGCIGDLALLDSETRFSVQNLYACVDDVEFFVNELSLRWTQLGTHDKVFLRDRILERAKLGLTRANELLPRLQKV